MSERSKIINKSSLYALLTLNMYQIVFTVCIRTKILLNLTKYTRILAYFVWHYIMHGNGNSLLVMLTSLRESYIPRDNSAAHVVTDWQVSSTQVGQLHLRAQCVTRPPFHIEKDVVFQQWNHA